MPRKAKQSIPPIGTRRFSSPAPQPTFELNPDLDGAITDFRAERQAHLDALAARDAATPAWLLRLRPYIDAAIAHQIALTERDEAGYTSADKAGEQACEALWTQVVKALPPGPREEFARSIRHLEKKGQ